MKIFRMNYDIIIYSHNHIFTVYPRFIIINTVSVHMCFVEYWDKKNLSAFPPGPKVELTTYGIFLQAVYDSGQDCLAYLVRLKKLPSMPMNFFKDINTDSAI